MSDSNNNDDDDDDNRPINLVPKKFKEAQLKQQIAILKFAIPYESSSSEEGEVESKSVLNQVLKTYNELNPEKHDLNRTINFIKNSLESEIDNCLVCISKVRRSHCVWSCVECFCIFHLPCIQKWARDCIANKNSNLAEFYFSINDEPSVSHWVCPKCRRKYTVDEIPKDYQCFCQKTINPTYQPLLVPHSCGETCLKDLIPKCGHKCLLLCHPGPCPVCPMTVSVSCYCGKQPKETRRCINKNWSCNERCGKLLICGRHTCSNRCHPDNCRPCTNRILKSCNCGSQKQLVTCSRLDWKCSKVCNKLLSCGHHRCAEMCHRNNECGICELTKPRLCPCGKSKFDWPCTLNDVPTCNDTCGKIFSCGHACQMKCHKGECGKCFEIVKKSCRCQKYTKELPCNSVFFCETKCKLLKTCMKHSCNKKCCEGVCYRCDKICNRPLNCGNHKCNSICHAGPCYPCCVTESYFCRCGVTSVSFRCGRRPKNKVPQCKEPCQEMPKCHHKDRKKHFCHFGDCPPCQETCLKLLPNCNHPCTAVCHSSILVTIENNKKVATPCERSKNIQVVRMNLECPPCMKPVEKHCLGKHSMKTFPCSKTDSYVCDKPCGQLLSCGNHYCNQPCHDISTNSCDICLEKCKKQRPNGCTHECNRICHSDDCYPCTIKFRVLCHCGLNKLYVTCNVWQNIENRDILKVCGDRCPKLYDCGHRCLSNCHPGQCPNANLCMQKTKVTCPCKRIKFDLMCLQVRLNRPIINCDRICLKKQKEAKLLEEKKNEEKRKMEELKQKKELCNNKMFQNRKKSRDNKLVVHQPKNNENISRNIYYIIAIIIILLAFFIYYLLQ